MYELIYTEKGKANEAIVEIGKVLKPLSPIEGYRLKLEPLLGMKDLAAIM